ncbi:hypothetical protein EPYR_02627 [Erwinia pyrifoliae DSM 12163]|nr:hypothetical protein CPI84_06370 [Erwinia pyrifoliae]CAY75007.1 hypothetical protein EPYR_02627 [Erwinia pyrifoliae DSM 12163]
MRRALQYRVKLSWRSHIADACGFNSLRRFNAVFSSHYRLSPSRLRTEGSQQENLLNKSS